MSIAIWMTGLPCSGKTTIAKKLSEHIPNLAGLDGDEMINPYAEDRKYTRNVLSNHNFIEVYVKCSVNVCEKRDVRGMYKKARDDKIKNFIGLNGIYQPPTNPELIIDTENSTIEHNVQTILDYLSEKKLT